MAKDVKVAGSTYLGVTGVELPLSAGNGTARFVDTSGDSVTAEHLENGYTAHDASGNQITGTMSRGAPLIVPGELTAIDGMAAVEIETELADIYAAAAAGRAVFLEGNDDGDATTLQLVAREYDDEEETYSLTFGAALFVNGIPAIISVSFNNETEGFLDVELMTDTKYDIEIRHNGNDDTWTANEYNIDALMAKRTPISVRAIEADGYQRNYFVFEVTIQSDFVEVVLLDMDPGAAAADQVIQLLVYPDGRVLRHQ